MRLRPVLHLDGCHYSVMLGETKEGEAVLIFTERDEDLAVWAKPATCGRCLRLMLGDEPRLVMRRDVEVPPKADGAGATLVTVTGMADDIDKAKV